MPKRRSKRSDRSWSRIWESAGEPAGEPEDGHAGERSGETVGDAHKAPRRSSSTAPQSAPAGTPGPAASVHGAGLRGIPCSPGIASGPAAVKTPRVPGAYGIKGGGGACDPDTEWRRLEDALSRVKREMKELQDSVSREIDVYTGSMYEAFALTLEDPALREKAREVVFGERRGAGEAWALATEWIEAKYAHASSELLRLRAVDIEDVRDRVLDALGSEGLGSAGTDGTAGRENAPSLLVVRDLSAADVALLNTGSVLGICTAGGGAQSHAAIFARAVGLPMVAGLGSRVLDIVTGTPMAMDGSTGEVTWDPEKTREMESRRASVSRGGSVPGGPKKRGLPKRDAIQETPRAGGDDLEKKPGPPVFTRDGRRIEVCANVSSLAEIRAAVERGAEGVGVLRTEFLFVKKPKAPSEDEQFALYETMVRMLGERPLTVRTLDAGGDKAIPYLSLDREDNPF